MRTNILAFAAGIVWLQFQPALPGWWGWGLLCAVSLLAFALLVLPFPVICRALVFASCVLLGFCYAAGRAECRLADRLDPAWEGRDVSVIGVIAELPQRFGQGQRFVFAVEQALTPEAVVPGRVILSWYAGKAGVPPLQPGERWRLAVRLKQPHGNVNPHGFDYEAWLLERGIRASGYVRPSGPPTRLSGMVWRPGYVIERLRSSVRESFHSMLPEERHPYAGVLVALAIGDQRAIGSNLWNVFNRTGVTHLMSISGSHITMVAALAALLVAWVWRRVPALALRCPSRRAGVLAGLLAALLYSLIAGFGMPAQRTVFMLAIAALALLSGRRPAASRILALALCTVLLIDPWAVLAAGFWMSFGTVAALLFVGAAWMSGERGGGWRQVLKSWGSVQWAATLATLPILLLVFQQFSLVSPLANAIAIPVIGFVITPMTLLAALLHFWPLSALAHQLLAWLMIFLHWCASLPVWQAAAPPLWAAVVAMAGVLILLLPRGMAGRCAGVALMLPVLWWPAPRPAAGEAWIDVLDVGQGLAVLVRTSHHALLYDTGPRYSADADAGQRLLVPYLRSVGVSTLDTLVLTHGDSDHAGGLASVRAALPVRRMLSSSTEAGAIPCLAGQVWDRDGVRFRMLFPFPDSPARTGKGNHLSCVLRIEAGGRSMLLTGDTEEREEASMLESGRMAPAADVVLVPHHGSRASSSQPWVAATQASHAIVSAGYRNRFGHPKDEVISRYAAMKTRVWRTDRQGAIRVRLGTGGVQVDASRQQARYWRTYQVDGVVVKSNGHDEGIK